MIIIRIKNSLISLNNQSHFVWNIMARVQHLPVRRTKYILSFNDSILLSRSLETKIAKNIFGINLDSAAIFIILCLILTLEQRKYKYLPYSVNSLSKYGRIHIKRLIFRHDFPSLFSSLMFLDDESN